MRSSIVSAVLASSVVLAACSAGTPEAPAPWSPVGTYEFTTVAQGTTVGGTMNITETAGVLAGLITVDPGMGIPPMPAETIEVAGNEVTITADVGGDVIFMQLLFAEDDTFDGSWTMSGDGGDTSGRKTGS